MGEMANDVLEGFLCQECLQIIDGESPGYPRTCAGCGGDDDGIAAPLPPQSTQRIAGAVRDLGYPLTADALEAKSKPRKRGKKGRRG